MENYPDDNFLPPRWTANPFRVIRSIAFIVFTALIIGIGLPAVVALVTHTFDEKQVEAIFVRKFPKKYQELVQFRSRVLAREIELARINSILMDTSAHPELWPHLASLIQARQVLITTSQQERSPIIVSGFSQGNLLALWPLAYACLGILAFVIRPNGARGKHRLGAGLWIFLFI
jgi:hypothetical protein